MSRRPAPYFDEVYISSLDPAPRELFYLSERAIHVLNLLAPMLLWDTRWYNGHQRVDRPAYSHDIYEELKIPMHLEDLIAAINAQTQAVIDTACCTSNAASVIPTGYEGELVGPAPAPLPSDVTVGAGALPQPFLDEPLHDYDSSGTIGWDDYAVYLCDAAHVFADGLEKVMRRIELANTVNLFALARDIVADLVPWLFPGRLDDWIIWTWQQLYSMVEALGAWLAGAPTASEWDDIWSAWANGTRRQVVCKIAQAVSADSAAIDVRAELQSLHAGSTWDGIWALYPLQRLLREVFEGATYYEGPLGDCDCEAPLAAGYNIVPIDIVSLTYASGTGTETDLGDGLWAITHTGGTSYRRSPTAVFSHRRDLSGWTVAHHGIIFEMVDPTTNIDEFGFYNGYTMPTPPTQYKSLAYPNAAREALEALGAYNVTEKTSGMSGTVLEFWPIGNNFNLIEYTARFYAWVLLS